MEDVEYFLRHENLHLQAQGFATLISTLKAEKNEKNQRKYRDMLFDCLKSPSPAIPSWSATYIRRSFEEKEENLLGSDITQEAIIKEVSARLSAPNPGPVVELLGWKNSRKLENIIYVINLLSTLILLDLLPKEELSSHFLRISASIPASHRHLILSHLKKLGVKTKLLLGIRLIHSTEIDDAFKRVVAEICLDDNASHGPDVEKFFDAVEHHLPIDLLQRTSCSFRQKSRLLLRCRVFDESTSYADDEGLIFDLVDAIGEGVPDVVSNILRQKLTPHPVFLTPLLNSTLSFQELVKINSGYVSAELMSSLKELLENCKLARIEGTPVHVETLTDYFNWVASERSRIDYQLQKWNSKYAELDTYSSLKSIAFLIGLYSMLSDDQIDVFLELFQKFSAKRAHQSLLIFLHFTFFTSSDETKKRKLLRNLAKLNGHQNLIRQVFRFLLALTRTPFYQDAIEAVGELWERNTWLINEREMTAFLNINLQVDGMDIAIAKLDLYARICKTEHGETLLNNLLSLLNSDSIVILVKTINAFAELSRRKIIEADKIDGKLSSLTSKEDSILVAYCDFLSSSTENEAEFPYVVKCCKGLWSMRKHQNELVRVAVWKALCKFSNDHLMEITELVGEEPKEDRINGIMLFQDIADEESDVVYESFCRFLRHVLEFEVENLPKTIYTDVQTDRQGEDPLVSTLIPVLAETSNARGNELASLTLMGPLTSSVLQLPRRLQKCMLMFSNALTKALVNLDLPFQETMETLAAWKNGTETLFKVILEARRKNSPTFSASGARDLIVDELRRSMDQIKEAAVNVVIALPFLSNVVSDMVIFEDKSSVAAHQHWQISVLEFLFSLVSEDYKPRSHPLFQNLIERTELVARLALISAAMILQRRDYFDFSFLENPISKVSNWAEENVGAIPWMPEFVKGVMPHDADEVTKSSELRSIISMLKSGKVKLVDITIVDNRHDLKILANILNVDEITSEIFLDTNMRVDQGTEELFTSWLDGQAKHIDASEACNLFMTSHDAFQQKYAQKLAKTLEKSTKFDKSSLSKLLSSVRRYYIGSQRSRSARFPSDYNKLFEKSILRETLQQIRTLKEHQRRQFLIGSLHDIKRSDGRSLPPLDWSILLNQEIKYDDYSSLFLLAVQQANTRLLTKLLISGLADKLEFSIIQKTSDHILKLSDVIPKSTLRMMIRLICRECADENWNTKSCASLGNAIQKIALKYEEIVNELAQFIPKIETAQCLESPFFEYFGTLSTLAEKSLSILFKFWSDLRRSSKDEEIIPILLEYGLESRYGYLVIMHSYCSCSKRIDKFIDTISKMIPLLRMARNQATSFDRIMLYWQVFIVFVCSASVLPVPLCSYSMTDEETWKVIEGMFDEAFYALLEAHSSDQNFMNTITLFLTEMRMFDAMSNDDLEKINQCLRRCLNRCQTIVRILNQNNMFVNIL